MGIAAVTVECLQESHLFFGGDLLKINEEIMKVNTVGYGSTNILLVDRQWMGTGLGIHTANSLITKVDR